VNPVSLTDEISDAAAKQTGLPFKEVYEYLRRIREQEQFPKLPRAKELPPVSDTALANLLIALLSGLPPQKAHIAVHRLADATLLSGDHKHIEQGRAAFERLGAPLTVFLDPKHTFTQAVAALFGMARKGPAAFEETFRYTSVSIDQRRYSGKINLEVEDFTPLPKSVLSTLIDYSPAEEFFDGDLQIHAQVSALTIAALARAADRVTP